MTYALRYRRTRFLVAVGVVGAGALLVLSPTHGASAGDAGGPARTPTPIVEIDPGPIHETIGPRVSPASPGRASEARSTGETVSPFAGLPVAPDPLAESVIGPDGRTQQQNTEAYPHRAIGHLEIIQDGRLSYCTGWLIDENSILTAGHCAYERWTDNPIETAHFIPGRNAGVWPYTAASVVAMYAPVDWRVLGNPEKDWAVMQLNWDIGAEVGWFGFYWLPGTNRFAGTRARVQGYPADQYLGTQWQMAGTVHHSTNRQVFYPMDTAGGQSGSPVYKWNRPACNGPCGFAIHSYGASGNPPNNRGTRITAGVFDTILQVRSQNG